MIEQNIIILLSDKGSFSPKANSLWINGMVVVTGLCQTNGGSGGTKVANDGRGLWLSPPLSAGGQFPQNKYAADHGHAAHTKEYNVTPAIRGIT